MMKHNKGIRKAVRGKKMMSKEWKSALTQEIQKQVLSSIKYKLSKPKEL